MARPQFVLLMIKNDYGGDSGVKGLIYESSRRPYFSGSYNVLLGDFNSQYAMFYIMCNINPSSAVLFYINYGDQRVFSIRNHHKCLS